MPRVEQVDAATHTIFLAEVQGASARSGSPLTYFRGTFGRFEQPLDDAVYQELRERVLDREVGPGQPLTIERLAGDLDVGRAPIYHALQKLSTEGLVSVVPRQGYVVTPLTVDVARQAYDARAAIECGVLDQVGDRLDRAQLATVRAAAEATLPWIHANRFVDLERFLMTNQAFHDTIVGLAGNGTLLAAYRRLAMAGVISRALRGVQETDDRITGQHLELAMALEARDVQAARGIVLAHAELGKKRVRIAIEAAGGQY